MTQKPGTTVQRHEAQTEVGKLAGQGADDFRVTLEKWSPQIAAALGDRFPVGHFIEIATTAFLDPRNKLEKCSLRSVMHALVKCAQMRLKPDGKECAIIPRWDKTTRTTIAYAEPMVQGVIRTMLRTGTVKKVEARVVKAGDHFDYAYGAEPYLIHKPTTSTDRGGTSHAYAIVWLSNGERQFEVVDRDELDKVRRMVKENNDGKLTPAWVNWEEEMHRKIAVRRLSKYIEQNADLAVLIAVDDALHEGRDLDVRDVRPEIEDRSLEERAEAHADRRAEELRAAMARQAAPEGEPDGPVQDAQVVDRSHVEDDGGDDGGEDVAGVSLDAPLTWGKYRGRTIRSLLEEGGGARGYATHFMVGEKCTQLSPGQKDHLRRLVDMYDAQQDDGAQAENEAGASDAARGDVPPPPDAWGR